MALTLGPILVGTIMLELETKAVPTIMNHVLNWKRFVEDTLGYVKSNKVEHILKKLNSFHKAIQFTYEF